MAATEAPQHAVGAVEATGGPVCPIKARGLDELRAWKLASNTKLVKFGGLS